MFQASVVGSTLAFAALVALVMRHTFGCDRLGLIFLCSCLDFRVWIQFLETEVNVFYLSIRTTANYQFDEFRTAGVTGNAIINSQGQGDNPVCSNIDEISQPSRPFSPRAATALSNCVKEIKSTLATSVHRVTSKQVLQK